MSVVFYKPSRCSNRQDCCDTVLVYFSAEWITGTWVLFFRLPIWFAAHTHKTKRLISGAHLPVCLRICVSARVSLCLCVLSWKCVPLCVSAYFCESACHYVSLRTFVKVRVSLCLCVLLWKCVSICVSAYFCESACQSVSLRTFVGARVNVCVCVLVWTRQSVCVSTYLCECACHSVSVRTFVKVRVSLCVSLTQLNFCVSSLSRNCATVYVSVWGKTFKFISILFQFFSLNIIPPDIN
jgi:hypothetical protein